MKSILLKLLIILPFLAFSKKDSTKTKLPSYIDIAVGFNNTVLRDYATSPLNYSGSPSFISLANIDRDLRRESTFRFNIVTGSLYTTGIRMLSYTSLTNFGINQLDLFQIKKWSSDRLNVKIGGQFNSMFNIRTNEDLMNNGVGFEVLSNLFLSSKLSLDVSRKTDKQKKILFIKYRLKQRRKSLDFGLNIGVVNTNFRNGFVYAGQEAILNQNGIFTSYEFNLFKGQRYSTNLDYTIYLKNNNAIQFSYWWDAVKTAGNFNEFEMASHTFKFSLWCRLR